MQKPANEDLSQAYSSLINITALNTLYEGTMDAALVALGRNVTLYLNPAKSLPASNAENFNPYLGVGGQDHRLDTSSVDTGNKGYELIPITVVYKAHIKHGPVALNENNPFELNEGQVQLTTVYSALEDISEAIEASIDGQIYIPAKSSRPVGLSDKKYIISVWSRKTNPGSA